jgi:hypothetical protein
MWWGLCTYIQYVLGIYLFVCALMCVVGCMDVCENVCLGCLCVEGVIRTMRLRSGRACVFSGVPMYLQRRLCQYITIVLDSQTTVDNNATSSSTATETNFLFAAGFD